MLCFCNTIVYCILNYLLKIFFINNKCLNHSKNLFQLVSTDIVLLKSNCVVCTELMSTGVQLLFGLGYPMVLAPTSALMVNIFFKMQWLWVNFTLCLLFRFKYSQTLPLHLFYIFLLFSIHTLPNILQGKQCK